MNNNAILYFPDGGSIDGYSAGAYHNSFTTNWFDKRSAQTCNISVVFTGSNAPTGSLVVQGSNAPENPGGSYGMPAGGVSPVDAFTVSTTSITVAGVTGLQVATSARWVRVVYTSSSDVGGLTIHVYANAPYNSPG